MKRYGTQKKRHSGLTVGTRHRPAATQQAGRRTEKIIDLHDNVPSCAVRVKRQNRPGSIDKSIRCFQNHVRASDMGGARFKKQGTIYARRTRAPATRELRAGTWRRTLANFLLSPMREEGCLDLFGPKSMVVFAKEERDSGSRMKPTADWLRSTVLEKYTKMDLDPRCTCIYHSRGLINDLFCIRLRQLHQLG